MERNITLKTGDMHCASCEKLIERAARDVKGVRSVKSDYSTEMTEIVYDDAETDLATIRTAIEKEGHTTEVQSAVAESGTTVTVQVEEPASEPGSAEMPYKVPNGEGTNQGSGLNFGTLSLVLGFIAILVGLYLLLVRSVSLDFSSINENTGIAVLLVIGFLTGFHCIGMCGGFVLSYSGKIKKQGDLMPHLQYGAGKTISYTIIGAVFGLLGSIIAFTTELRGSIAVIAGLFLVLYGINMLNLLPSLRKLQPRLPSFMPNWEWGGKGPLVTGLLNGLMLACGPLMALYIFAAGTGSPVAGAKALFFFGLGTLVPMLTFGVVARYLSAAFTRNVVRLSGVMVIVLGLLMANNGLALLGTGIPLSVGSVTSLAAGGPAPAGNTTDIKLDPEGFQVIEMNVTGSGWAPNSFVLKKGVPVKWEIDALELNGCNSEVVVHDYGLDIRLKPGMQTVQFTPQNTGTIQFSCGMGMIRGQFLVYDSSSAGSVAPAAPVVQKNGGCGCGG